MINKRISKVTMLTCLMLGGIVNAQEFYTCVPKKSWWGDVIKSNVPSASDLSRAVAGAIPAPTPKPQPGWKLIKKFPLKKMDIPLTFGKYKIEFCESREFEALDGQSIRIYQYETHSYSGRFRYTSSYLAVGISENKFYDSQYDRCGESTLQLYKYE